MPKLKHDCHNGAHCFIEKRHPKIELFDDCFPGNIAMGDMDGVVEVDGRLFVLEWKTPGGDIDGGQRIMFERISKTMDVVFAVVYGDTQSMEIDKYYFYINGEQTKEYQDGFMGFKRMLRGWVKKSRSDPLPIDEIFGWIDDYAKEAV